MAPARTEEGGSAVSIPEVPVTEERRPFIEKEGDSQLKDPGKNASAFKKHTLTISGTARANEAASTEYPNGTTKDDWARKHKHQTVLQQHLLFFDCDNDGIIWPQDTFIAFYRLGYNLLICIISVFIIHPPFSYPTNPSWIPDPLCRIHIKNIHKDKHGSDSGSYDTEGRFVPQKFEDIFSKYASGDKQGITLPEVFGYLKGQRAVADPFGWSGAAFECKCGLKSLGWISRANLCTGMATYLLLWPEDGRMQKDDIRRIFDGSIFFEIAARREKKLKQ
jgi:peroxygenase